MTFMGQPTVVLGVTGSVAAYKSAEIVRRLGERGIDVRVAMTRPATRLVGPPTLRALSGHPVMADEWDAPVGQDGMDHIAGSRPARLILVAPASADFIAKAAHGIADDLLLAMLLARRCPAMVAPAMNQAMWDNPATQENLARIQGLGIEVVSPEEGGQACGEHGMGRLADVARIVARAEARLRPPLLAGRRVTVSAGATCEHIDPMRIVTNTSTGKMGVAVAQAAQSLGARVTLVAGRLSVPPPPGVETVRAETGAEMGAALARILPGTDLFVAAAAVGDFRPASPSAGKIPSGKGLTLRLERTADLLGEAARLPGAPYCVGFAAETGNLVANARRKMGQKGVPMIVANEVADTVGSDECDLTIVEPGGTTRLGRLTKGEAALRLLEHVAARLDAAAKKGGRPARARKSA